MSLIIVVGVQWGDEGKGKVVDYLTEKADLVVRFQGGSNAGHTLVVDGEKTALRLIPSGILRKNTRCLLAAGVVVEPHTLLGEFEQLKAIGVDVTPERFGIASEVQLILPYHMAIDLQREENRAAGKIGTTGKGIGPAYEDVVTRSGIRMCDLTNSAHLKELIQRNVEHKNSVLKSVLGSDKQFNADKIVEDLYKIAERLAPYITDVSTEVENSVKKDRLVVFEGAQGSLLDISHGTYPYVTSSNTVAGYACVSAGFGPRHVDNVIGICKAYCTRVGSGPFPSEDTSEKGDRLREAGGEFGTVTGRPRRCGWFDAMAVRRAIRINGIDNLFITKLDVLSGFDEIKIGTTYKIDGNIVSTWPAASEQLQKCEVDYETLPGWSEDITKVRTYNDLPETAKKFLVRIEELVETSVCGFSVGPDRTQTIVTSDNLPIAL